MLLVYFASCTSTGKDNILGVTEFYEDFWWHKYDMEKAFVYDTLIFDFNNDAKKCLTQPIKFQIVTKDEFDMAHPLTDIIVRKNGQECKDNIVTITTEDNEVVIGIAFTADAIEQLPTIYLHPINLQELGLEDGLSLTIDRNEFDLQKIGKVKIHNPLAKGSLITLIAVIIFLLTWIIIAHLFVNPSVKFSKVLINYGDGDRSIRMDSAYELICTNKPIKVSFFKKVFVGDIKVEVNDFWEYPLTIKSGSRRNRLRLVGAAHYHINVDTTLRREPFIVTNSRGEEVTIQTT